MGIIKISKLSGANEHYWVVKYSKLANKSSLKISKCCVGGCYDSGR